jgi:hypothetical protein
MQPRPYSPFDSPATPAYQAIGHASAFLIQQHTVPRDTLYLVRNGIEPNEAARRIVTYQRMMRIWGVVAFWMTPLFWVVSSLAVVYLGLFSVEVLLAQRVSFGMLVLGLLLLPMALAVFWAIYVLPPLRLWRHAARGCAWEEAQPWWRFSRRPESGPGVGVDDAPGRGIAKLIAYPFAVALGCWVFLGVMGSVLAIATHALELLS